MTDPLNMDLTEDFDRVPEPITTQEERIGKPAEVIVVAPTHQVVDNDIVSEDIFVNPKEGETPVLPEDTEFVITNDRIKTTGQIYRLGDRVRGSGLVSVETIDQLELLRGDIRQDGQERLNNRLFTQEPTATNVDMALSEIDNTVVQRCDDLQASLKDLTTNYLKATENTIDEARKRFIERITQYNRTLATLLFECEIEEFSDVKFLFNGGQSLKGLYNQPIFSYAEESQSHFHERLATFQGTPVYDDIVAFSETLVTGDLVRYVSSRAEPGTKTAVGSRIFTVSADEGLGSPDMSDSVQSMISTSIANAIAGLGNGAAYSWFNVFLRTLKTRHNAIREALATLAGLDNEKPVEERLAALMTVSDDVNQSLAMARTAMTQIKLLEELFESGLKIVLGTGQLKLGEPLQVAA